MRGEMSFKKLKQVQLSDTALSFMTDWHEKLTSHWLRFYFHFVVKEKVCDVQKSEFIISQSFCLEWYGGASFWASVYCLHVRCSLFVMLVDKSSSSSYQTRLVEIYTQCSLNQDDSIKSEYKDLWSVLTKTRIINCPHGHNVAHPQFYIRL